MSKHSKSFFGSFFYTFGTIFIAAVVAVCAMNFANDGRAFQAPVLSVANAAVDKNKTAGTDKNTDDYTTLKYDKSDNKNSSKSSDKASKPSSGKSSKDKSSKKPVAVDP